MYRIVVYSSRDVFSIAAYHYSRGYCMYSIGLERMLKGRFN